MSDEAPNRRSSGDTEEAFDVAVIGAGIAGCYAADRLAKEYRVSVKGKPARGEKPPPLKTALLEAESRAGGRLKSARHCDHHADYGAMRFPDTEARIRALLAELDLQRYSVAFERDRPENLFYARGTRLQRSRMARAPVPYDLRPEEKNRSPSDLVSLAIQSVFPEFQALQRNYDRWRKAGDTGRAKAAAGAYRDALVGVRIGPDPLAHLTWHNFLRHSLSGEAVRLIEDFDGYESRHSNGGAASWLDNFFFSARERNLRRLSIGMSALPQALLDRFRTHGGKVYLGHKVLKIAREGGLYRISTQTDAGSREVLARRIILTIPKPALGKISLPAPASAPFLRSLDSVRTVDAFKLFLVYPKAWWCDTALGLKPGRSTTDLPLRQVYYYPAQQGRAVMMAAYCNGPDVAFWHRLWERDRLRGAGTTGGNLLSVNLLARIAHSQICEMHADPAIPRPVEAHAQFWRAGDGAAGWHVWEPGADRAAAIHAARQPNADEDIYLAGEAWSMEPGSIQGALQSADDILQRFFGLCPQAAGTTNHDSA